MALVLGTLLPWLGPAPPASADVDTCRGQAAAEWTKSEKSIWRQLCEDGSADVGDAALKPTVRSDWKQSHLVSARFLEQITTGSKYADQMTRGRIVIRSMWVKEDLGLSDSKVKVGVHFYNSRFERNVYMSNSEFAGNISLSGSFISGDLNLSQSRVHGHVFFSDEAHARRLNVSWATIAGGLFLASSTISGELDGNDVVIGDRVNFDRARINNVDFAYAKVVKYVRGLAATVKETVNLNNISVEDDSVYLDQIQAKSVTISFAEVNANIELDEATIAEDVSLNSVDVGSNLILSGGKFASDVNVNSANIAGRLICRDPTELNNLNVIASHVGGEVGLSNARVTGKVFLNDTTVDGPFSLAFAQSRHAIWSDQSYLSVAGMSVKDINDSEVSWPRDKNLNGFVYERAAGAESSDGGLLTRSESWYRQWLGTDRYYFRQSYKQLEASLRSVGNKSAADKIAMMNAERESRQGSLFR